MKTVCKSILIALVLSWFGTSSTREDDLHQDAEEAIVLAHITDSVCLESAKLTAYYFAYPSKDPWGKEIMLSGTITNGESVTRQEAASKLIPLLDNTEILVKDDIFRLLRESGVGVPAYYEEIPFEVDGETGTYCRSRSGCYFCFFQQKIEWIWLYEQHPDLFKKAMEFEKDGYTWNQNESLADLIKPERIRQIKLDIIRRQKESRASNKGTTLAEILGDDIMCTNCFI